MFKVKHLIFRITAHFKIRNNRTFGPNFFNFKILPVHFKVTFENSKVWCQNVNKDLLQCEKAGTWQFLFRWTLKITGWNPYHSKYFFLTNRGKLTSKWGLGPEVKSYKIKNLTNVEVRTNHYGVNTLNLYSFYAKKTKAFNTNYNFKVLNLMVGGGESFQHFIIDLLPILFACRSFLINNPRIPILLPQPSKEFSDRNFYFDLLEIKNELIDIEKNQDLQCQSMYFVDFKPHRAHHLNHTPSWNALAHFLAAEKAKIKLEGNRKTLTFIKRESSTRNINNENEIIDFCHKFASINNLNFEVVNPSDFSRIQIFKIMQNTQIAVSVHGGQGLNILGMEPKSTFIEFVPTKDTDTLGYVAHGLKLNYLPIPVNGSKFDQTIEVPLNKISELEKNILLSLYL